MGEGTEKRVVRTRVPSREADRESTDVPVAIEVEDNIVTLSQGTKGNKITMPLQTFWEMVLQVRRGKNFTQAAPTWGDPYRVLWPPKED